MADWTAEHVEEPRKGYARQMTTGSTAKKLGISRSTVMGKVARQGLEPSSGASGERAPPPSVKSPQAKAETGKGVEVHSATASAAACRPSLARDPFAALPGSHPKPFIDLEAGDCRWPIGKQRPLARRFCAEPVKPSAPFGAPYCPMHAAMSIERDERARRKALAEIRNLMSEV